MMMRRCLAALLPLLLACAEPANPYLSLAREPAPEGLRLRLVPAPGVRISAQQKPYLQAPDSSVRHFDSPALTADSTYFTEPPELLVAARPRGRIVASVCPAGEYVCRPVVLSLR